MSRRSVAILGLSVPPIIATLASGLVASSATLVIADGFTALPDPGLRNLLNLRPLGVPLLAIVVAALTVLAVLLLRGTTYGRSLTAIGQNPRAAERAGLPSSGSPPSPTWPTAPWIDRVLDGQIVSKRLNGGTKGSHLIVDPFPGAPSTCIFFEAAADRRPIFVFPWKAATCWAART
ncbi:hypothetical protein SHIRM173S_05144 [Streptomyces hirsutus]